MLLNVNDMKEVNNYSNMLLNINDMKEVSIVKCY